MALRDRLLAAIQWLKTQGPTFAALLAFVEFLLANTPPKTLAKGAEGCCDDPCEACDAVQVALVEALVANARCRACCEA